MGWLRRAGSPCCVPVAAGHFVVRLLKGAHGSISVPLAALQPLLLPRICLQPPLKQQSLSCWEMGILLEGRGVLQPALPVAGRSITPLEQDSRFHRAAGPVLKLCCCCLCHNLSDSRAGLLLCYGSAVLHGALPPCPRGAAGAWPGSCAAPIADTSQLSLLCGSPFPVPFCKNKTKQKNGALGGILTLSCVLFFFFNVF